MKIQIIDSEVVRLDVSLPSKGGESTEHINFSFTPEFPESEGSGQNSYNIVFKISINHRNGYCYAIEYKSNFRVDDGIINNEFKESPFIYVNSPAIAYPFLRAYVANLMLICGHEPIMLPTINFQALKTNRQNSSEE